MMYLQHRVLSSLLLVLWLPIASLQGSSQHEQSNSSSSDGIVSLEVDRHVKGQIQQIDLTSCPKRCRPYYHGLVDNGRNILAYVTHHLNNSISYLYSHEKSTTLQRLYRFAEKGDLRGIQRLFDKYPEVVNTPSIMAPDESLLMEFLKSDNPIDYDIATLLIKQPNINLDFKDEDGFTALHGALSFAKKDYSYIPIVKLLLECGANPNLSTNEGKYPFDSIDFRNRPTASLLVRQLLKYGANPNLQKGVCPIRIVRKHMPTPLLFKLIAIDDADLVDLYLQCGGNPNVTHRQEETWNGIEKTALIYATEQYRHDIMVHLVQNTATWINAKDSNNNTALSYSLYSNDIRAMAILMSHPNINIDLVRFGLRPNYYPKFFSNISKEDIYFVLNARRPLPFSKEAYKLFHDYELNLKHQEVKMIAPHMHRQTGCSQQWVSSLSQIITLFLGGYFCINVSN